jgi:hypothetical protein
MYRSLENLCELIISIYDLGHSISYPEDKVSIKLCNKICGEQKSYSEGEEDCRFLKLTPDPMAYTQRINTSIGREEEQPLLAV